MKANKLGRKKISMLFVAQFAISLTTNAALYEAKEGGEGTSLLQGGYGEVGGYDVYGFDASRNALLHKQVVDSFSVNNIDAAISALELLDTSSNNEKTTRLLVIAYIEKGLTKKAQEKLTPLLNGSTKDAELYALQGAINAAEKNAKEAKQNYQRSLALDKNSMQAYLGLAKLAVEEHQLEQAKEFYHKVLIINDKYVNAYIMLAKIANQQNNKQEVERILTAGYNKVQEELKDSIKIGVVLGKYYAGQKQPEKILQLAKKINQQNPENIQALAFLAQAQIVNNKKSLLEGTLRKIIIFNKEDIEHRFLLAKLLFTQNKIKSAISVLDEIISKQASNSQGYILKIRYLLKLGDVQQALAVTNQVEKQFPQHSIGKHLKADVYQSEKQLTKAIELYKQAYAIKPANILLYKTVDTIFSNGNAQQAIEWLIQQLEKDKANVTIRMRLATAYEQTQKQKLAIEQYQIILQQKPNNPLVLNNLAWLYHQQGNQKALGLASRAYKQVPNSATVADTYGEILLAKGDSKEGLKILQRAHALRPESLAITYHLAQAYKANAEIEKAIGLLRGIEKSAQLFDEKAYAMELLKKLSAE